MSNQSPAEGLRQQIQTALNKVSDEGDYYNSVTDHGLKEAEDDIIELVTAYAATVEREARLDELNDIPHIPIFLYSTRHDSQKLADAMEMSKTASLHVLKRRDELVRLAALQGPQDGDAE